MTLRVSGFNGHSEMMNPQKIRSDSASSLLVVLKFSTGYLGIFLYAKARTLAPSFTYFK